MQFIKIKLHISVFLPLSQILFLIRPFHFCHFIPVFIYKIFRNLWLFKSRDSAVGIATGYWLEQRGIGVRVLVSPRIFYLPISSRLSLRPTQPPIQRVPGIKRPRLRKHGCIHPLPHTSPWRLPLPVAISVLGIATPLFCTHSSSLYWTIYSLGEFFYFSFYGSLTFFIAF
jgi:hypothetical protein